MTTPDVGTTEIIPEAQCWQLLRESVVGRLGVIVDHQPDIFPVNHVVDHGTIVFRSGAGTKVFASLHQVVAFEVDGYDPTEASAWSVVVHGVAADIHETNEALRAMTLPLFPWQAGPKPRFIRIEPTEISGRRIHVAGGTTA